MFPILAMFAAVPVNIPVITDPQGGYRPITVIMGVDQNGVLTGTASNPISVTTVNAGTGAEQVQGTAASGSAISGNPVMIGGNNGGNALTITATIQNADAIAAGSTQSLYTKSFNAVFNGTTWDRARDATSTNATTGLGITGAGVMAKYNATLPTYTDGQFGNAQMDTRGGVFTVIKGAQNTNAVNVSMPADAASNAAALYSYSIEASWNGSSIDRNRNIIGAITDGTGLGVQAVEIAGSNFTNITTATTTTVKSGKGVLHKISVNTFVASATITIYDNTAASGTKIGTFTLPATITGDAPYVLPFDIQFNTGLTIVTSAATDITAIYR